MSTASKRLGRIVQNGLLAIYSIFALFPLIWMLILTFKSDAEMYTTTFVFTPTLANYKEVLLHTDYMKYMLDSLIVSGGAVLISVLAGVPPLQDTTSRRKKISHSRFFLSNSHLRSW